MSSRDETTVSTQQLTDWRYQCEERIRRWEQGQAVPEWHLDVPDTLALLDLVRDLKAEAKRKYEASDNAYFDRARNEQLRVDLGLTADVHCCEGCQTNRRLVAGTKLCWYCCHPEIAMGLNGLPSESAVNVLSEQRVITADDEVCATIELDGGALLELYEQLQKENRQLRTRNGWAPEFEIHGGAPCCHEPCNGTWGANCPHCHQLDHECPNLKARNLTWGGTRSMEQLLADQETS